MPIPHRKIRGKLHYSSDHPERAGAERGREHFTLTVAADGQVGEPRVAVSASVLAGVRDDYGMVQYSVGREPGEFWLLLNEYRASSLVLLQNLPALLERRRAGAAAP